jgi:Holliday junction DNA helicase RuvA
MISRVRGTLESVEPVCVVSVGGVGFELQIPEKDRAALKGVSGEVSLHTYLYVREDRLTLFGFRNAEDRELFVRLIEVSGIGPKIAVRILGEHPTARIVEAVRSEDHAFLCGLPGLGRKTAERLTVELKDKLGHLAVTEGAATTGVPSNLREEAILALTTLRMQRGVAERALEHVDWKSKDESSLASIVKQALRHASGA